MKRTELTYQSRLPVSSTEARAWHDRPGAFERLTPPWMNVRVVGRAYGVLVGNTIKKLGS